MQTLREYISKIILSESDNENEDKEGAKSDNLTFRKRDNFEYSYIRNKWSKINDEDSPKFGRQSEMDYGFPLIHPDEWKRKRDLVDDWMYFVYENTDGSTVNMDFWLEEVKTVHWLGFFTEEPVLDILNRYLDGSIETAAELSTIGYFKPTTAPYSIGIQISGVPIFASSSDLYSEMLDTLTDNRIDYFRKNFGSILKTPSSTSNPDSVLISKRDALYRAENKGYNKISEVLVQDWQITRVLIQPKNFDPGIVSEIKKLCENYNIEIYEFDQILNLTI